jgi:hypothetical protein
MEKIGVATDSPSAKSQAARQGSGDRVIFLSVGLASEYGARTQDE